MTLELYDVEKRVGAETHIYPTTVSLAEGEFNILLGTTLSGKTTLMQLMAGLERPTSGTVHLNGRDVTAVSAAKRNVSMVHQQFINYPNFTVFENIASPLKVAGMRRDEIRTRVEKVAEMLRLSPMLKRKPSELSGGQQQRTALARALVKDADLVLLDEPLANLDFKLREELRDELPRLFEDRGCTVVYATTEPGEALLLGGHTATLHEGRITQFGPTGAVYRQPHDLTTARVFSDPPINTAPITKHSDRASFGSTAAWKVTDVLRPHGNGVYTMAIRPHFVSPVRRSPDDVEVTGEVQVAELSGSESIVHFRLHDGRSWVSQSHGVHPFNVGDQARMYFDPRRCLYFDGAERLIGLPDDDQGSADAGVAHAMGGGD